ncbi:MAG: class I SAM-dependent methyltransferase [Polyangia bacterium]
MTYSQSSRARLNPHDLPRFPESTLFHGIARVLCEAECLPRKELFESWEVARRARRRLRGRRVVDLACGHGLVGQMLMLLDPRLEVMLGVDKRIPKSAVLVHAALSAKWPRLGGRVTFEEDRIQNVRLEPGDLVVSCHACGRLTDHVIALAVAARVPVVVLPCCQAEATSSTGGLEGWVDAAFAIDLTRAAHLRANGYDVYTQHIPIEISVKNRLLIGQPAAAATAVGTRSSE